MIPELVIATHNQGKAREIAALLEGYVGAVVTSGELGLPVPVEDADTFEGNALIKARATCAATGKPSLADDSGLAVAALDGAPGVYSADWAGEPRDFNRAMALVHEKMGDAEDRSAAFKCCLALVFPDGREEVVMGSAAGEIVWPMRGDKGFGYDPIFQPLGYEVTFAEMSPEDKHAISHRADAFKKLADLMISSLDD